MKNNEKNYSGDLLDISRGFSKLKVSDENYYFRHFLYTEILELDEEQNEDIERSVKSGIQTEKQLIKDAKKAGSWSDAEEEKIKSLQWTVKKSTTALEKIQDPNQRKVFNDQIEKQRVDLDTLRRKKASLVTYSAESLSEVKKVKKMVQKCVYLDRDLTESIGEDPEKELTAALFKRYAELNSKQCILGASFFGGFFDIYVAQHRNPLKLFDVNFRTITIFQKNLIILSNALFNKMKNVKIPDEISNDPLKILEYEEKEETDNKVSHGIDDLKARMKARGGELKAEDFLTG